MRWCDSSDGHEMRQPTPTLEEIITAAVKNAVAEEFRASVKPDLEEIKRGLRHAFVGLNGDWWWCARFVDGTLVRYEVCGWDPDMVVRT